MSSVIAQILAEAEPPEIAGNFAGDEFSEGEEQHELSDDSQIPDLQMTDSSLIDPLPDEPSLDDPPLDDLQLAHFEEERRRRIYRGRTVAMLRRYLRYSMETGRLPSVLGSEFFRAQVTSYSVSTFEDRVIFVYDMEICLARLDEFSRQLIARHILQEHDQEATARLLGCAVRTVRTYVPIALDLLSGILLEVGLMDGLEGGKK